MLIDGRKRILIAGETKGNCTTWTWHRFSQLYRVASKYYRIAMVDCAEPGPSDNGPAVDSVMALARDADAMLIDGRLLCLFPFLRDCDVPIAIDLYDPLISGDLTAQADAAEAVATMHEREATIREQLATGDFFVCASEAQRDYWMGMLTAFNRVNPIIYAEDRTISNLLAVFPWGIDSAQPEDAGRALKGVLPGILEDDVVAVWALEDMPWQDHLTLIHAVTQLDHFAGKLKVVFLTPEFADRNSGGLIHVLQRTSASLGLTNRCVFFVDWATKSERNRLLREADFGISLHKNSFESGLAARPEIAAYLGAGLPVLASGRNAEIVLGYSLGQVVPEESVDEVVRGLQQFLSVTDLRQRFRGNIQRAARDLSWDVVTLPLRQWLERPRKAPDLAMGLRGDDGTIANLSPTPVWALPHLALHYLRTAGISGLAEETCSYLRWKLAYHRR